MEPHPEYESLSAFMDGEAAEEEAVNRLLQQNEHAAKTLVQYRKMSAHLQALEGPAPAEDFVSRTMSAISAPVDRSENIIRLQTRVGLAITALAASIVAFFAIQTGEEPVNAPAPAAEVREAALLAAFETMPLEDLDHVLVTESLEEPVEMEDVTYDLLVASLIDDSLELIADYSAEPGALLWYDEWAELGEEEEQEFTALLQAYGGEV